MLIPNPNVGPMALRWRTRWPPPPMFSVGPKMSTLQDTFDSQNTKQWNYGAGASVASGQLFLTCSNAYNGRITTISADGSVSAVYNLTNSQISFQVLQRPSVGTGTTEFYLNLLPDGSNGSANQSTRLVFYWNNGSLGANEYNGGVVTSSSFSTNDSWWRIRHGDGGLYWETSVDGNAWTTRFNKTPGFNIEALHVGFYCGYYGAETNPAPVVLDNINIGPSPYSYRPTLIANPNVGPMALRRARRLPYVASQKQGFVDGADQSLTFSSPSDGFADHPGAQTSTVIPNPFVGPQALRHSKRMPYVPSVGVTGSQAFSDAADAAWVWNTLTDGAADRAGAKTTVVIPNPFVGPMALRVGKRMPYVSSQKQGYVDGADQSFVFTLTDDGFIDHPGAKTSVVTPNPFVGPQAMRVSKHLPFVASQRQGYVDGADQAVTFTTPSDGFIDHPGARTVVAIPTPFVGPQALRHAKRMPYVSSQKQGYVDAADIALAFTTVTDGASDRAGAKTAVIIPNPYVGPMALRVGKHLPYVASQRQGYVDGANQTLTFAATDDGFVDHPGARTAVLIPNPYVGPQALRVGKHLPYVSYRVAAGAQAFSDGADATWVLALVDDGFIDHPGARTGVIIPNPLVGPQALRGRKGRPYVAQQRQGYVDAANSTWTFGFSTQGVRGVRDGADLVITLTGSEDGFIDHPGARTAVIVPSPLVGPQALRHGKHWPYVPSRGTAGHPVSGSADAAWSFGTFTDGQVITIDVPIANIVVVGPNEMRTVSVSPGVYTVVVSPNEVRVDQVTPILPVEQV